MGFLFEGITMSSFLAWALLMGGLILINELSRRYKQISILVFCILPVILAVCVYLGVLGSPTGKTWFGWVKVVSALAGVYGFMWIRYTNARSKKFAVLFPVSILALNIAEAVFREFQVYATFKELTVDPAGVLVLGGPWNILNAIAGILCIVTLTGFVGIRVSKDKSQDMIWPDMTWLYIIGYTLWNFAYVLNCISTRSMYAGFGILLAALVAEYVFKRGAWLQHRAQILSLYAMFSLSVDFQSQAYFQIAPVYEPSVLMTVSILSIVFNVGVFASMLYVMVTKKKNPLTQEIYVETKAYQKNLKANHL